MMSSFGYDRGVINGLLTSAVLTRTFPEIDTTDGSNLSVQGTVYVFHDKQAAIC